MSITGKNTASAEIPQTSFCRKILMEDVLGNFNVNGFVYVAFSLDAPEAYGDVSLRSGCFTNLNN